MTGNAAFILNLGGGVDPSVVKYRGTLGIGGTITSLPEASEQNQGDSYIVITDGTYAGQTAVAGDAFISNGEAWTKLPSGDDPALLQTITMPEPSNYLNGKIIQYIGDTNSNYVNGVIYKCQANDISEVSEYIALTSSTQENPAKKIEFISDQTIRFHSSSNTASLGYWGVHVVYYPDKDDETVCEAIGQGGNDNVKSFDVVAGSMIKVDSTYNNIDFQICYSTGAYMWKPIGNINSDIISTGTNKNKNIIVQYNGNSTADYKKGHFYRCQVPSTNLELVLSEDVYSDYFMFDTVQTIKVERLSESDATSYVDLFRAGTKVRTIELTNAVPSTYIAVLNYDLLYCSTAGKPKVKITYVSNFGALEWQELSVCDYEGMTNKPQINGVALLGNKDTEDLKIEKVLTQAEYDALPDSKLTDNVNYFISDGQSGTIRYNAETDTIQIFDGTTWHNWKLGGLQGVDINDLDYTDWSYIGKGSLVSTYNYASKPLSASAYTDGAGSGYGSGIRIQTASAIDLTGMNYLRIIGSCANVGTNATIKDSYADTALALVQDVTGTVTQLKKFTVNGNFSEIIPVGVNGKYKIRLDCGAMPMTTGSIVFNTIKFTANNPG